MSNADWFKEQTVMEESLGAMALEKAQEHDFSKVKHLPLPILVVVLDRLQRHYGRLK